MNRYSLRVRAQRALVLPAIVAVAVIVLLGAGFAAYAVTDQLDEQMVQNARLLQLLARHEAAEHDALGDVEAGLPMFPERLGRAQVEYRIWSGRYVLAQTATMPKLAKMLVDGFHVETIGDRSWRFYVLRGMSPATTVELAEPLAVRYRLIIRLTFSLALPAALLVMAIFMISRRGIALAVRPLESLSTAIDQRGADDLALVDVPELPNEVAPMVSAINGLLGRMDSALTREREFSDSAAHELRTPLAALKARAQLVQQRLAGQPELADDLRDLARGVDRTAHVVDRLLELARTAAPGHEFASFNLTQLIESGIAAQAVTAARKNIQLSASLAPDIVFHGLSDGVALAFRNLLENAIKYTHEGGEVAVHLSREEDRILVVVADNGPGIAQGAEERIFDRFRRERQDVTGAGLGLALVRAVCTGHGGSVSATRLEPNGLAVTMALPVSGSA